MESIMKSSQVYRVRGVAGHMKIKALRPSKSPKECSACGRETSCPYEAGGQIYCLTCLISGRHK